MYCLAVYLLLTVCDLLHKLHIWIILNTLLHESVTWRRNENLDFSPPTIVTSDSSGVHLVSVECIYNLADCSGCIWFRGLPCCMKRASLILRLSGGLTGDLGGFETPP